MTVFVDSSAWHAAADAEDASQLRASVRIEEFAGRLLTSDHVPIERWYLASRRLGVNTAETLLNRIRRGIARVEATTLADLEVAAQIREAFTGQRLSIVDRTSWSVMRRLGINDAMAFDRDFSIYRFGLNRRQAFAVHT